MEALFMKAQNRTPASFLHLASILMSKLHTTEKKNCINLSESFYSTDRDLKSVIYFLANNPKTSPDLLDHISTTCTPTIAESIAMNESTSRATLRRLANHNSPLVRAAVTDNRYAPFEVLSMLSEDQHPDVRFSIAENPDVPKLILTKLAVDDNPFVATRACTTLERLGQEDHQFKITSLSKI